MEKDEKWGFIVNPIAGKFAYKTVLPKLEEEIKKRNINSKIVFTKTPGDATKIAADFVEKGFKYVVAVGGDGTSNEVTKSLIGKDVIYGLVPCGTGNDYNNVLGFPERFEQEHWDIFFQKNTINADAGVCNGNKFVWVWD